MKNGRANNSIEILKDRRGNRRLSRENALAYFYQLSLGVETLTEDSRKFIQHFKIAPEATAFFLTLVDGVRLHRIELDEIIEAAAENWRLTRMGRVDLSILRLASYELLYSPDIDTEVILDEAIELAKTYGNSESGAFVNGILDRIAKSHRPGAIESAEPEALPQSLGDAPRPAPIAEQNPH